MSQKCKSFGMTDELSGIADVRCNISRALNFPSDVSPVGACLSRPPSRGVDQPPNHPWSRLAINDHGSLSILAISFDGCNRL